MSIHDQTYKAEMGFTHAELLNGLAAAVAPYVVREVDRDTYVLSWQSRSANLHLGQEKIRKIASIRLPVTDITIEFTNFSEIQLTEFLDRFKKYLHRGGG